jgi:hypothetical protein
MLSSASRAFANWAESVSLASRFAARAYCGTMIRLGCIRSHTAEGGTLLVSAKKAGARLRKPSYTRLT